MVVLEKHYKQKYFTRHRNTTGIIAGGGGGGVVGRVG